MSRLTKSSRNCGRILILYISAPSLACGLIRRLALASNKKLLKLIGKLIFSVNISTLLIDGNCFRYCFTWFQSVGSFGRRHKSKSCGCLIKPKAQEPTNHMGKYPAAQRLSLSLYRLCQLYILHRIRLD